MSWNLSNRQIPPPENEVEFENLCLDLYRLEFGDKTQKNGSRGQSQNGVDIFCPDRHIGIQCKKKDLSKQITDRELKTEIQKAKKFQPALKRFILATTCKRDAKIQKTARLISKDHENLFSVEIHSWDEIKEFFDKHPEIYKKYYPDFQKKPITPNIISFISSESRHQELNRIRDLIDENKPKIAFVRLENFKREKWEQLEDKEKYRVLSNMAIAKMQMRQEIQAFELFVKAWQFNKEDENANVNCALAYLNVDDIKSSKKHIKKAKQLNPLNITAYVLEVFIKDKENQSLSEIVSFIPQKLKTKYQIALVLSEISIKRKQYKEAEKWLNVLFNNTKKDNERKDIQALGYYADMSLSLILSKPDVFSGRHVPDDLKGKIEDIISIYQNLITDSLYIELREFNPNWYLHCALALELKGDLDDSIHALKTGIQYFPTDHHLKKELSRLFKQKNEPAKSIPILEELLGLQSLSPKDSSKPVNKTLLSSNQMDISESFNLALDLADLYFHNKQSEKAYNLLNQIRNIPALKKEDRLEAEQYRIFRLINSGKIAEAEKILNPLFEKDNIRHLILKSKIEAFKEKTSVREGKDSGNHKDKKIQYLKKAYSLFEDKQYNEGDQNSKQRLRDIQSLSPELYDSKMYKELEPLLEKITNKNLNHPNIFNLLVAYFENGKNRLAIELAKNLLKKFPQKIEAVNILFLIYESLGNKKTAIQYYEDFLEKNPDNDFIKIELALAYIRSENIPKAKKLLEGAFNLNQLSTEQINRLSFSYMKTGSVKKALETQYQCIKRNPKDLESQKAYFSFITFHRNLHKAQGQDQASDMLKSVESKSDTSVLHPKKVDIDCYVQIKDVESLDETDLIIEETAEIYTPNHELSKVLLGKKKDEIILFRDKKYQILKIQSKYIYKYQEILKETEKRFPSKNPIKSVPVPINVDTEKLSQIFKKFAPNMSKQYENLDKLFELYNKGKATIGLMAKMLGKHPIEVIGALISSKKYKLISAVPVWDNYQKTAEILENKTDILIDLSALIVIHQLEIEKYIEKSKFSLYICQSTLDSLKEYIEKTNLHSKDGLLTVGFDEEGDLRKSFIPADRVKQDLKFWIKVKTWAVDYCKIKSLSEDHILSRKERQERENRLGKEFFHPLLALDNNTLFLCEDAILIRLAEQEYSVSGIRFFDFIEYLERQIIIDTNQSVKFKAQLVKLNQTYIPIDHNILFYLLKETDYSISDLRFQRALYFLSPVSHIEGVVNVIANFLIEMCQSPALLPHRKQMITKEVLDKASLGRDENPKTIAHQVLHLVQIRTTFLPILHNEIYGYIKEWLSAKVY